MTERTAFFTYSEGVFFPANKNAVAVAAVLSRRVLDGSHMILVRTHGFTPRLTNGTEIGKVEIQA